MIYIPIPNIYLGLGFEFGPKRIRGFSHYVSVVCDNGFKKFQSLPPMKQWLRGCLPSLCTTLSTMQVEHEIGVAPTGLKKIKLLNRYELKSVHN